MADPAGAVGDTVASATATVKKFTPINWAIISNPWNWVILLLMVVIATMALDIVLQWYHSPDPEE